jgi:hypothetical protein
MPTLYTINPRIQDILLLITCLHFHALKNTRRHDGPGFSRQKLGFWGSNLSLVDAAVCAGDMVSAAMGGGKACIELGRAVSLNATAYPYLTGGDHVTSRKTTCITVVTRSSVATAAR